MPTLDDIARFQTTLSRDEVAWLQALVTDWQIIADLAFSDLVLWVPDAESKGMWAAAQIRPTTGPTTLLEDVVGTFMPTKRAPALQHALSTGELGESVAADDHEGAEVHEELVPVRRGGEVCGAVVLRSVSIGTRSSGALEGTYRESAAKLVQMIHRGDFPLRGARSELADSMRVGDGFLRVGADGLVMYASPNAQSAYRRLGLVEDLVGSDMAAITTALVDDRPTDRGASGLFAVGGTHGESEVENTRASLLVRVIPLTSNGTSAGSIVLLRDVTELRLRERELVSKEATIREIHHRVKNNLQTVAALLRLQGRRLDAPEARAALDEAVRRVGSIALVHETLSQSFDENVEFDEIADRLLSTVLDVTGQGVRGERIGTFGSIPGVIATPLAMVLTELIQNATEHAFGGADRGGADGGGGRLTIAVNRIRDRLRLRVSDNGAGMPSGFEPSAVGTAQSLGLSIVSTLVESELGGSLTFEQGPRGGTTVAITLTV
ncbi:MAG: sensor histidine kinase [Aeromicrobium sp.]